jgi:hypothetical protein
MSSEIRPALRRELRERAERRCEYCGMPDDIPLLPHELDYVIALKHGGLTTSRNLAYACFQCNRAKGSDIASLDPVTGKLTPLYNPRLHVWHEHFQLNGAIIEPITAVGRVTVKLLNLNNPARVAIRENLL